MNKEFKERNIEYYEEEEDCIRCSICGSDWEVSNVRGRQLCADCAYDMYCDDIYRNR